MNSPESDSKSLGIRGEEVACRYLRKKGFRILERNYVFRKGEIDIIAKDGDVLVFVEVKTRNNLEYGRPEEAIPSGKIRQVRRIAKAYLFEKKIEETECRFDVVAILTEKGKVPEINHIPDAF